MTPAKTSTPAVRMIAMTTIHTQRFGTLRKGDAYSSDAPEVIAHKQYFAPADATAQELRQIESDIFEESTVGTWAPPPAPPPVRMRVTRPFIVEVVTTTNRRIEAGEIFMSDDPIFQDNHARNVFEPADKPRRGGK